MKLEIINSSMGFVADFWNFAEEKSSELNTPEKILGFFNLKRAHLREFQRKVSSALSQVHDQKFGLRHLFNRVAQSFTAQTRVLHAAVRHLIDAKRRDIPSNQPAHFEFLVCLEQ